MKRSLASPHRDEQGTRIGLARWLTSHFRSPESNRVTWSSRVICSCCHLADRFRPANRFIPFNLQWIIVVRRRCCSDDAIPQSALRWSALNCRRIALYRRQWAPGGGEGATNDTRTLRRRWAIERPTQGTRLSSKSDDSCSLFFDNCERWASATARKASGPMKREV